MEDLQRPAINAYEMMLPICRNLLRKQTRNAVDYENEDGLLVCGICGETKQTYLTLPNPTEDNMGKILTTKACGCDRKAEQEEAARKKAMEDRDKISKFRSLSMIDSKFNGVRFDQLERTKFNEKNLRICERYVAKFPEMLQKNQGLLLWGDVGTGKSFAAAAIANALLEQVVPVVMVSFVEILKRIESKAMTQDQIVSLINTANLVVFDDLGAERDSDYALEKVYAIVDARYRKQLPMIVTTNLPMEQMKGEEDIRYRRIYDRIFENCYPMQFTGPSWRRVEANRRFSEMTSLLKD